MHTPRALWKAVLQWDVFSLPVKLYPSVRPERVAFHLLHDRDFSRVRKQWVCPLDHERVDPGEAVKGLPVSENQYALFTAGELKALEPAMNRSVAVREFVRGDSLDPRYVDKVYYLGPDGQPALYAAWAQALHRQGMAGICQFTMRGKTSLAAVQALGPGLALAVLRYAGEVLPASPLPVPDVTLDERERATAVYLVDAMSADFAPEQYRDEYQARLRQLVESKQRGETVPLPAPLAPAATPGPDLLAALEASVAAARARRPEGGAPAGR